MRERIKRMAERAQVIVTGRKSNVAAREAVSAAAVCLAVRFSGMLRGHRRDELL